MEISDGVDGFSGNEFVVRSDGFAGNAGGSFVVSLEADGTEIHLSYTPGGEGAPYEAWLEVNFSVTELSDASISGWDADIDLDGLSTLVEYALGGDPRIRDADLVAVPVIDSPGEAPGDRSLSLTFTRLLDRTDINYRVQAADSLEGSWAVIGEIPGGGVPIARNGGSFSAGAVNGNTQEITFSDSVRVEDAAARFMRIEILRHP